MTIGPSIDPAETGITGLVWLFVSYGYVLYAASNFISEGSELLLLVPSMAGLVGGVVLPLLGAVPDGAIILFSGLGSIETAQETLSVGVGALAGSTIMLLTIPFCLSIVGGAVDINPQTGVPNYLGKPKLTATSWSKQGVTLTEAVQHGGIIMAITTVPYFLIQIPAFFLHGPSQQVAQHEHWWSLVAFLLCLAGLVFYMRLQLKISREGEDRDKRMAVTKKMLKQGQVSLSGAVAANLSRQETRLATQAASEYQSLDQDGQEGNNGASMDASTLYPPPAVAEYLKEILIDSFKSYDKNRNGSLDKGEVYVFFKDYHESVSEATMARTFQQYDKDNSGCISFDEFIGLAYSLIKLQEQRGHGVNLSVVSEDTEALVDGAFADDVEEEEMPESFTSLPPEKQQAAIKRQAFILLSIGTVLVVVFSDPMVDVMQEIANRAHLSPFYVSFILAPLASNASEVIASQYYASKKTRKTITVALTALEGAACMNNTFCLSIFMGLVFFRGLAWQYTAETITIVAVQLIVGSLVQKDKMSTYQSVLVACIFPLSIAFVAGLEAMGFD